MRTEQNIDKTNKACSASYLKQPTEMWYPPYNPWVSPPWVRRNWSAGCNCQASGLHYPVAFLCYKRGFTQNKKCQDEESTSEKRCDSESESGKFENPAKDEKTVTCNRRRMLVRKWRLIPREQRRQMCKTYMKMKEKHDSSRARCAITIKQPESADELTELKKIFRSNEPGSQVSDTESKCHMRHGSQTKRNPETNPRSKVTFQTRIRPCGAKMWRNRMLSAEYHPAVYHPYFSWFYYQYMFASPNGPYNCTWHHSKKHSYSTLATNYSFWKNQNLKNENTDEGTNTGKITEPSKEKLPAFAQKWFALPWLVRRRMCQVAYVNMSGGSSPYHSRSKSDFSLTKWLRLSWVKFSASQ